jgi:hypothetical protein
VQVDEIKPGGSSVQLTGDEIRARYRSSLTEEKLAKPGEINRCAACWQGSYWT